jgi:hypothetical protein
MTTYETTLVLGIVLFAWGVLRFFRQIIGGEVGGLSVLLMMGGGVALVAADNYSPKGVQITDVVPAIMHLVAEVKRSVL